MYYQSDLDFSLTVCGVIVEEDIEKQLEYFWLKYSQKYLTESSLYTEVKRRDTHFFSGWRPPWNFWIMNPPPFNRWAQNKDVDPGTTEAEREKNTIWLKLHFNYNKIEIMLIQLLIHHCKICWSVFCWSQNSKLTQVAQKYGSGELFVNRFQINSMWGNVRAVWIES